jgi:hypothetical protein
VVGGLKLSMFGWVRVALGTWLGQWVLHSWVKAYRSAGYFGLSMGEARSLPGIVARRGEVEGLS